MLARVIDQRCVGKHACLSILDITMNQLVADFAPFFGTVRSRD
jgi:hypothetical protein